MFSKCITFLLFNFVFVLELMVVVLAITQGNPKPPFRWQPFKYGWEATMTLPSVFPPNLSQIVPPPQPLARFLSPSLFRPISGSLQPVFVPLQRASPGCLPVCSGSALLSGGNYFAASVFTLEPVAKVISWQLAKR